MRACVAYPPLPGARRAAALSACPLHTRERATKLPVKRHRGTPGQPRDTHGHTGARGHTRHGSHRRITSQPSIQTQRHTLTTTRRPKPRPTQQPQDQPQARTVDRSPRPTQKRPPQANPTLPPPASRAPTGTRYLADFSRHSYFFTPFKNSCPLSFNFWWKTTRHSDMPRCWVAVLVMQLPSTAAKRGTVISCPA